MTNTNNPFLDDGVYKVETISHHLPEQPATYSDILLRIRLELAKKYADNANILDVCCAAGQHLDYFNSVMQKGIGIDFSLPYLQKAITDAQNSANTKKIFACSDAKVLPFPKNYFDLAYSFSALYIIPEPEVAISEISRVLKTGGICILDLGNKYSLNAISVREYHKKLGWAKAYNVSIGEMKQMINNAQLSIIDHRAFQILPLWGADRPKWLILAFLPIWTKLLKTKIGNKMLDEWVSNMPLIKYFAFRHIFVCKKIN